MIHDGKVQQKGRVQFEFMQSMMAMSLSSSVTDFFSNLFVYNEQRVFSAAVLTLISVVFYRIHGWLFVLADWYGFLDRMRSKSLQSERLPSARLS
jgi:hypothetical protein